MPWPCVSFGRYADMRESRDDWKRNCDTLIAELLRMKKDGFIQHPDPNEYIAPALSVAEADALAAEREDDDD